VRLLHLSDTHLGFRHLTRIVREGGEFAGLNQREVDVYMAWRWAVDLAIERGVDVVVHAGDLFDSPRPTNRALVEALQGIRRLDGAGIPFVVVAGNHSTPRLRQTGSVFRVLEQLTGVHAFYRGYGRSTVGDVTFHGIPHTYDDAAKGEWLSRLTRDPEATRNVAVIHCAVPGITGHFAEISQMTVEDGSLPADFDYVALGHVHRYHVVRPNAVYSGSLEPLNFGEHGETKGAVIVDLDTGRREFVPRETRPVLSETIDCTRRGYADIEAEAAGVIESAPAGAMLRLVLDNVLRSEFRSLDIRGLRARGGHLLHLEIAHRLADETVSTTGATSFGDLTVEFEAFLADRSLDAADRDALLALGREILLEVRGESGVKGG